MPIYEYKCENCEKITELFQHYKTNKATCNFCGSSAKSIISKTNFNAVELKSHRIFGHGDDGIIH